MLECVDNGDTERVQPRFTGSGAVWEHMCRCRQHEEESMERHLFKKKRRKYYAMVIFSLFKDIYFSIDLNIASI